MSVRLLAQRERSLVYVGDTVHYNFQFFNAIFANSFLFVLRATAWLYYGFASCAYWLYGVKRVAVTSNDGTNKTPNQSK